MIGHTVSSFPYPPAGDGFWNPVTATLNWCEEDYYATVFIAEIINTLTNIFFVYLAIKGIWNCRQNGHDTAWQVAYFNMLFIGIGSAFYHMTLNYWMQLLDELSMIYLTSTSFYALFSYGQSRALKNSILLFTASFSIFVTLYYYHLNDPVFHQNAFAVLATTVIFTGVYKTENLLRSSGQSRKSSSLSEMEQTRLAKSDLSILHTMRALVTCGLVSVGLGFLLWNLDNMYCSNLRRWRREVGLPWGILLEGHGWWHLLTGLAIYYNQVWLTWLRYCLKGQQEDVLLHWPSLFTSLPSLHRKNNLPTHTSTMAEKSGIKHT